MKAPIQVDPQSLRPGDIVYASARTEDALYEHGYRSGIDTRVVIVLDDRARLRAVPLRNARIADNQRDALVAPSAVPMDTLPRIRLYKTQVDALRAGVLDNQRDAAEALELAERAEALALDMEAKAKAAEEAAAIEAEQTAALNNFLNTPPNRKNTKQQRKQGRKKRGAKR